MNIRFIDLKTDWKVRDFFEMVGYRFAWGVMYFITYFLILFLAIRWVGDHTWRVWWPDAYDATDDARAGVRSGLRLYVDHGTGCQYLKVSGGSLVPRMLADGTQVCLKSSIVQ